MPRCLFAEAVRERGGRKAVADILGCSIEFVRQLSAGESNPSMDMALRIEDALGISVRYWRQIAVEADAEETQPGRIT